MTDKRSKLIEILNSAIINAETGVIDPTQIIAEVRRRLTGLKKEIRNEFKENLPPLINDLDNPDDGIMKCPDCQSTDFHNEFFDDGKGKEGTANVCNQCGCCFSDETEDYY